MRRRRSRSAWQASVAVDACQARPRAVRRRGARRGAGSLGAAPCGCGERRDRPRPRRACSIACGVGKRRRLPAEHDQVATAAITAATPAATAAPITTRLRRTGCAANGRGLLAVRAGRVLVEPLAQLARERARRAETVLGILGHRPRGDRGERLRHRRVDLVRQRRLVIQHGVADLRQRFAAERLDVGEQLVEDDAEREHVGAAVRAVSRRTCSGAM